MRNSVRMLNRWLDIAEERNDEVKYSFLENIHTVTNTRVTIQREIVSSNMSNQCSENEGGWYQKKWLRIFQI